MLPAFITALVFALIFSLILFVGFKRRGPGPIDGFVYFFLLILFFSWAIGSWLYPYGPLYWDVAWLDFFIVAFLMMLVIAVLVPAEPQETKKVQDSLEPKPAEGEANTKEANTKEEKVQDTAIALTFGLLFWLLIITLALLAISRSYYYHPIV
jgi:hypothetical protein